MAPKQAQPAAPVRRSNRIASKEAVSYTPTTARVIKTSLATKTLPKKYDKKAPAKKSAAPKATPVKKVSVTKSAAPKKAPAVQKVPAKKVFISTTPSDSVPSSSKMIRYPIVSKNKAPSPEKDSRNDSDAKASSRKSQNKVAGPEETDEDERIPAATGLGSLRRGK